MGPIYISLRENWLICMEAASFLMQQLALKELHAMPSTKATRAR